MTYLKSYQNKPKGRGRKSTNMQGAENARYYHTDHLVIPIPDNKRRRCMGEACTSIVKTQSLKCDVGLCIACFAGSQK